MPLRIWRIKMEAEVNGMQEDSRLPATQAEVAAMPSLEVKLEMMEITAQQIRQYIAPRDATSADIAFFMAMARSQGLNPFQNDIYMIPFKGKEGRKYAAVISYQVMLDRADSSGLLEGIEMEFDNEESPTRCTVTIHRKGWKIPFKRTTLLAEAMRTKYDGSPMALWATNTRQMLEKCSVTGALRFAIPACRRMPYIGEEIQNEPSQYQEQELFQEVTEAEIMEASDAGGDIDYLRGQYFKKYKEAGYSEDARHGWNNSVVGRSSTKDWDSGDYLQAISILDDRIAEAEGERMQSELGKDDDVPFQDSKADDESDVDMESLDDIQRQIDAKIATISSLLPTSITSVDDNGFMTWAWEILGDDLKGTSIRELGMMNLDRLIDEMKAREDREADEQEGAQGDLC